LLERGYTFVDVRSEPEFELGHPPGALNIPLQRVEGDRLVDNPKFMDVMRAVFRTTDPLLIACRSGTRSQVAIERLKLAGFLQLAELHHGFSGSRDAFGRKLPGWVQHGLPIETGNGETRGYARLLTRSKEQG
jgi:rhodanese-related sulfurtransferase